MENLINFLKELFTEPMIYWSATDYIVITIFSIVCLFIIIVILGAIWGFVGWLIKKKRKNRK